MKQTGVLAAVLTAFFALFSLAPSIGLAQSATHSLDEKTYIEIAERVLPSVVNITVEPKNVKKDARDIDAEYEDFFEYFQRPNRMPRPNWGGGVVSGSGVLVRRSNQTGYVVTNNHVVEPMDDTMQMRLTFHLLDESGTEYNRKIEVHNDNLRVIGRDELSDLAVVEFDFPDGLDIQAVEFADSDAVKIGEHVLALGNPLDLSSTVTRGIISAKSRYLSTHISLEKLLQTDAVIQPGNSGGPLVNLDGKIVGINNAIASRNGLWQGIGFAIPSNDAQRISSQLIDYGRVMRGFLGIEMQSANFKRDLVQRVYRVADSDGVFVMKVVPGSPADEAGLHVGDLLRIVDGVAIRDSDEMLRVIANKGVNENVELEVVRLDDAMEPYDITMTARLTERPRQTALNEMQEPEQEGVPGLLKEDLKTEKSRFFGLSLKENFDRNSLYRGLQVTNVVADSPAKLAGIEVGDMIIAVNGERVRTRRDLQGAMENPIGGKHELRLLRNGNRMTITVDATSSENE